MTKKKQLYSAPTAESLVVRFEGVICQSGDQEFGGTPGASIDVVPTDVWGDLLF